MLLIGSKAIKHHYKDFHRFSKDIDFAVDFNDLPKYKSKNHIEYLYNPIIGNMKGIATPDILYTLKISHVIGWDIDWEKHMFDITFLTDKGCKLDITLFKLLYNFWNNHHGPNKRSKLDMSAEEFFDNDVKCEFDHDFLHTLVNENPTYKLVLKEGQEVDVSEEKFNNLTFNQKCDLVREEVMVMSYERFSNKKYKESYRKMLKKFIINHAPIWEAIFIIENFKFLQKIDFDYIKLINSKLA